MLNFQQVEHCFDEEGTEVHAFEGVKFIAQ
jgi:hypothetical protein